MFLHFVGMACLSFDICHPPTICWEKWAMVMNLAAQKHCVHSLSDNPPLSYIKLWISESHRLFSSSEKVFFSSFFLCCFKKNFSGISHKIKLIKDEVPSVIDRDTKSPWPASFLPCQMEMYLLVCDLGNGGRALVLSQQRAEVWSSRKRVSWIGRASYGEADVRTYCNGLCAEREGGSWRRAPGREGTRKDRVAFPSATLTEVYLVP